MVNPRLVVLTQEGAPTTALYGGFSSCTLDGAPISIADLFTRLRLMVPMNEQPIPVGLIGEIDTILGINDSTRLEDIIEVIDEDQAGRQLLHCVNWAETARPIVISLNLETSLLPLIQVHLDIAALEDEAQSGLCADLVCALSGGPTAFYNVSDILTGPAWQHGGTVRITVPPTENPQPDNIFGCCGPIKKLYCPGRGPRVQAQPTCDCLH
jgi:hypothetical protein